jgi:D-xylose transport system ATP-binding protein
VRELGIGQKQLVEIVRAMDKKSRVLVLDEPTAALTEQEVAVLVGHLRRLRAQGTACIYISHKLDEVFALADRITVLRDGASITTLTTRDTTIPAVIKHMVGREITDLFPRRPGSRRRDAPVRAGLILPPPSSPSAPSPPPRPKTPRPSSAISPSTSAPAKSSASAASWAPAAPSCSCTSSAPGATAVSGDVTLRGTPHATPTPRDSIARGLVLVTEDRKRYGLVLPQPIGFNLSLSSLRQFRRAPARLDLPAEQVRNQHFFDALRIKAPDQHARVGGLSGGNQQKVVLGKALMTEPTVVMLDEPTRGIDVGAKLEVYELINRLTAEGKAVLLVSSELPELMGLSDRILMLRGGKIGGEFSREEATQEKLIRAAMLAA